MVQARVHFLRRNTWNTPRNKYQIVKTPGGSLNLHYKSKRVKGVHTPRTLGHKALAGLKHIRRTNKVGLKKRTVSRTYGGVLSHDQVRERIIRAFLIDEQKIVKRVLKAQGKRK